MKNIENFLRSVEEYDNNESKENYTKIVDMLYLTEFLLPIKNINFKNKKNNKNTVKLKEENVYLVYTKDNQKFIPVFTSKVEKNKWNKKDINEFTYSTLELNELLKEFNNIDGLVIDPFSINLTFLKEDLDKTIKQKTIFDNEKLTEESQSLNELSIEYTDLLDDLKQEFKKDKSIFEVYAAIDGMQNKKLLISIKRDSKRLSTATLDEIEVKIEQLIMKYTDKLDFAILLEENENSSLILKSNYKIYKRKNFFLF